MSWNSSDLQNFDPELYTALKAEEDRQEEHLELIASENYASPQVMAMQGSVMTNKYAEGYPGKRYYGGCEFVDVAENLAIERLKELYRCSYANVQPHSGSQANAAVYQALMQPGDTFVAMDLSAGGHLTHGSPVNFSGKVYNAVNYGVDNSTGLIDYDEVARIVKKNKPRLLIAGMSAYSRIIDWAAFRQIADEAGALFMVDMAHISGLVAADVYPSPVPHAHVVTSTTHKTLRGPRGGFILAHEDADMNKKLNSAVFPGMQGGPLMHVIAAKAIAFKEALQPEFAEYAQQVVRNAKAMTVVFKERGYKIVSDGTDCHMFLVDLTDKSMTGKEAEAVLGAAHITVNKNTVPGEKRSPFVTSGLRIGTPAMTTRGLGESECQQVAHWIADVLDDWENQEIQQSVAESVKVLCRNFPVYASEDALFTF